MQWFSDDDVDDQRRCQRCGSHVSANFRRTFGDESGAVHGCPDCMTYREMKNDGAATGIATDGGEDR